MPAFMNLVYSHPCSGGTVGTPFSRSSSGNTQYAASLLEAETHLMVRTENAYGDFSPNCTDIPVVGLQCLAVIKMVGVSSVDVQPGIFAVMGKPQTGLGIPPTTWTIGGD